VGKSKQPLALFVYAQSTVSNVWLVPVRHAADFAREVVGPSAALGELVPPEPHWVRRAGRLVSPRDRFTTLPDSVCVNEAVLVCRFGPAYFGLAPGTPTDPEWGFLTDAGDYALYNPAGPELADPATWRGRLRLARVRALG
jgi:hypothetical protein